MINIIKKKEKYKNKINELKNDLNNEKFVRKELQKMYENLGDDNKKTIEYVEKYNN